MDDMRIFKSGSWIVAEIPSLHVVTRAKSMAALKRNVKEAVEVAIESMMALKSMKIAKTKDEQKLAYA
jgi:predicted RNase H-like HicB family nuclease